MGPVYLNWEKDSMYACFCDMGFFGADCSMSEWSLNFFLFFFCWQSTLIMLYSMAEMCAKNDDPLTTGQGYRKIKITVGAAGGTLAGTIQVTFNGQTATLSAKSGLGGNSDSSCSAAFSALKNVKVAVCTITNADANTLGAAYNVEFQEWAHFETENNVFQNDGNPPLTSFTCDISTITSGTTPTCSITDVVASNVIGTILWATFWMHD